MNLLKNLDFDYSFKFNLTNLERLNFKLNKIDSIGKILEELKKDAIQESTSNKTNHFEVLQNLIDSPDWPSAVDPDLLCNENNELDKLERAEGIRDIFIDESWHIFSHNFS